MLAWSAEQRGGTVYAFTGTRAPRNWDQRRLKVRKLRGALRNAGYGWEVAWTTERDPNSHGTHVHGIAMTDVPARTLRERWGSRIELAPCRSVGDWAHYLCKGMTGTIAEMDDFLRLNAGRPFHWSSEYLASTKREAEQRMRDGQPPADGLTWHQELRQ